MTRTVSAEEARRLIEGATPGPWRTYGAGIESGEFCIAETWRRLDRGGASKDAHLIAAAPSLAATVIALEAERDRLRDILRCERGEWAPEGWRAVGGLLREWERIYPDGTYARVKADGRWWYGRQGSLPDFGGGHFTGGSDRIVIAEGPAGLKLEAIEAADLAAKGAP